MFRTFFLLYLASFYIITPLSMAFRAGVGVECIDMLNIGHEIEMKKRKEIRQKEFLQLF